MFQRCKRYVGAGLSTLMPISDGLGSSYFRLKTEKARLVREEMDVMVVYFRQCRHFDFDVIIC